MEKKQIVVLMADDTFSGPFWDEEGVDIGDCEEIFLEDETIDVTSITELKCESGQSHQSWRGGCSCLMDGTWQASKGQ